MAHSIDPAQRPQLMEGPASAHLAYELHEPLDPPPARCSWSTTAAASPISRVPYDILRKIMLDSQNPIHRADDIEPLSARRAPLNVSHVSQFWRRTALSTPSLWARIYYDISRIRDSYHKMKNSADAIAAMVERSQKHELYISVSTTLEKNVRFPTVSREEWEALARAITHPLMNSQRRWKVAQVSLSPVYLPFAQEVKAWPSKALDDFPLLEELTFSVGPSCSSGLPDGLLNANTKQYLNINLSKCTKLKRFTYDGFKFSGIQLDEGVTLPSLLELMLACDATVPIHGLKRIVAASPVLQVLHLPVNAALDNVTVDDADPGSFTSTSLRRLYISCDARGSWNRGRPSDRLPSLLMMLKFPSLSQLSIASKGYNDNVDAAGFLPQFSDFAKRSGFASLTCVTLNLHLTSVVDWIRCLEKIPGVVDLKLELEEIRRGSFGVRDSNMDDLVLLFGRLNPSQYTRTFLLCPSLRSLQIVNVVIKKKCAWIDSYVQMLVSRSPRDGTRYPTITDSDSFSSTLEGNFGTPFLSSAMIKLFFGSLRGYDPKSVLIDWYADLGKLLDRGLQFSVHHGEWVDPSRFTQRWEQSTRLH